MAFLQKLIFDNSGQIHPVFWPFFKNGLDFWAFLQKLAREFSASWENWAENLAIF